MIHHGQRNRREGSVKQCPFCREAIQDDAIKCRFCNEMLSKQPQVMRAPSQHRARRGMLASLGLLVVVAIVVYLVLPRGAKDAVNEIATQSGTVGHVVPWIERADTTLRRMLDGDDGIALARTVQKITHPLGENPSLGGYDVRRMGDRISVRISTNWEGGIVKMDGHGARYTTDVVWEFGESGHVSATIISDTFSVGMAQSNAGRQLDDWFRAELYPVLYSNTGE
jgi:predicted nucleic acid-binding Zn ribbon protein